MKKKWIFIVLLLLTVTSVCYSIYLHRKTEKLEEENLAKKKIENIASKIVKNYTDLTGSKHVVIDKNANQVSSRYLKDSVPIKGVLDTTALVLKIQKKQIEELLLFKATTIAERLKAKEEKDSLQRVAYYYKDRFLRLTYRPGSKKDTSDKGEFDFAYDADLSIVQYRKRDKVLGLPIGKKKSFIDISSKDPRTTINGVRNLSVVHHEPNLGLRLQGVSTFNLNGSRRISNGLGVQFDAGRFSILGTGYYNFKNKTWTNTVTGRYDIIRF